MINRDFEHLMELLDSFFSDKEICKKFHIIDEGNITGWETWLQVEFSYMLSKTDHEWWREYSFKYDNRKNKEGNYLKPDFLLRKKGWTTETYLAVEFKQNISPVSCVKNMISDLDKVSKIRKSEIELRSIWAVGVTKNVDHAKLNGLVDKYLNDKIYYAKDKSKHIQLKQIGKTPFHYIIM
ncbi:hypothetical protein [Xenorhabdus bovienii]|uniref:Uncharacterized protein n=4 Tax=Xenorhabdus bovienii TaxID=40576 RepID=A0A077PGL3_XENBV|nr:hypothetical protein [Xenorhabdus bovienii]CDG89380.1 conserved hypothetical protein [Xenorhabdus bovienii str. feltiae France]CDG93434.1 conserved hypothetical protein [Xenorhabdus bovienii str. feltiae Florida]CDG95216.1 conserved hypothetical protein [Xenorhabdus bovienii str. puntauvense]CDH01677.1 conserved hypothetical protein [Xenorhabdus bovienii str. feltiae Moldova]CDH20223.1 conserved hypothetical protein [Xenorhabdus bovienii str. kraussei Quebec]